MKNSLLIVLVKKSLVSFWQTYRQDDSQCSRMGYVFFTFFRLPKRFL